MLLGVWADSWQHLCGRHTLHARWMLQRVLLFWVYLSSHAGVEGILILRRAHLLPPHHLLQPHVIVILKVAHTLPFNVGLNLQERQANVCVCRVTDRNLWKIYNRGEKARWWNPCGGHLNDCAQWFSAFFPHACPLYLLPLPSPSVGLLGSRGGSHWPSPAWRVRPEQQHLLLIVLRRSQRNNKPNMQ